MALRLARLLSPTHKVKSVIRSSDHEEDIRNVSAIPVVLSLEDGTVSEFSAEFEEQDVVYFSAGAGGKGGDERTKKIDYEGVVKVYDAIEAVKGVKPRLILVSAVDIRDPEKIPTHYVRTYFLERKLDPLTNLYVQNEEDIAMSKRVRAAIPAYMHWRYEGDKNLVKRDDFKWTILRLGGLANIPGTGKASVGRTHVTSTISVS